MNTPPWLTARTIVPALALCGGAVVLLLMVLVRLAVTEALACAAVAAAGTAAWTWGYLRVVSGIYPLSLWCYVWFVAAGAVALTVPVAAALHRHANGVIQVAGTAVVGIYIVVTGIRALRKGERDRLLRRMVTGRSARQAARIAEDCERLLAGGLADPERAFAELNLAEALVQQAPGSVDLQQVADRSLGLVQRITHEPALDPALGVLAATIATEVASVHEAATGDMRTYELAVRAAEDVLMRWPEMPDASRARMLLMRADLMHSRASAEVAAAAQGAPQMEEWAQQSLRQALDLLDAAVAADPAMGPEARITRAGIMSEISFLSQDRELILQAVAEARRLLVLPGDWPFPMRAMAVCVFGQVLLGAALFLETDSLLDEAQRAVRPMLRYRRLEAPIRARLVAMQARLDDARLSGRNDAQVAEQLRRAARLMQGSPLGSLRLMVEIAATAARTGPASGAAAAYLQALRLMRDQAARWPTRRFRRETLAAGRGLAAEAAFWLTEDQQPAEAVLALESGRALSATQVIEREVIAARLRRGGHIDVARRFAECLAWLRALEAREPESQLAEEAPRWRRDVSDAGRKYLSVCAEIKSVDGFGDAFRPADFPAVARAARDRPIVYVAAAHDGGVALIVHSDDPGAVPQIVGLPDLAMPEVDVEVRLYREGLLGLREGRTGEWRQRLTGMRNWLAMATGPLWEELAGYPAVTMIPAGALSLLPLHAALAEGAPAIALAPNARIVVSFSDRATGAVPRRVLAVRSPDARWHLPPAQAAGDVAAIRAVSAQVRELSGDNATRSAVLAELPHWNCYHFTCHGRASDEDPLASGLFLRDGILTVGDVLAARVPDARLAVLAACESSVPSADAFDEALGLPSALMEAGIPGIIGSLWGVEPLPASLLVRRFYAEWDAGAHPAIALHRSQAWLRQVTNCELAQAGVMDAGGRHLTRAARQAWPDARPFEHPDAWAPFTYTGT